MEKLKIEFTIFVILVFLSFTFIVVNEKIKPILNTKVNQKIDTYIKENYSELKDINISKITNKNNTYQKEITNKDNKNLSFTIYYKNKKITDNYKTNYVEGKDFLNYISNKISKKITRKTTYKNTVTISESLDKLNSKVKEKLLVEEDLLKLSIYTVELELDSPIDTNSIINKINEVNNIFKSNNITPKNYNFTIIDPDNVSKSIKINDIEPINIENSNFKEKINVIIRNESK